MLRAKKGEVSLTDEWTGRVKAGAGTYPPLALSLALSLDSATTRRVGVRLTGLCLCPQ
jgi:hypothetical protein